MNLHNSLTVLLFGVFWDYTRKVVFEIHKAYFRLGKHSLFRDTISSQTDTVGNGTNRPLALRGHVTNASFKQWVGILLMPKIIRAHKNYLTPEIWEETHLREIFYGTLIFQQSSILEGMLLPSNMAAKTTSCLYLVQRFIVTLRCAVNVITSSFQHFPWSLSAKLVFRER